MNLTSAQVDRACGVLIASAAGDALGAGYEFGHVGPDLVPAMVGGGLGGFAPGEWTDDTSQAVAIARVAATGVDLRTPEALTQIAQGIADWYAGGPADVGIQTSAVLSRAGRNPTGAEMAEAARVVHERSGRSAGNGSLMRTGPVALAYLDDPAGLVGAAMAVSALTHHQDIAREACAVWCLMIRHAVLTGELPTYDDIAPWVPNEGEWRELLLEAETKPPSSFARNGWAVGALQAAWSAIIHTPVPDDGPACGHLGDSLATAIRIGHDTDTVAAIAGALLGARWGMSAVPAAWRRVLHGWPGLRVHDLEQLAYLTAHRGSAGKYGWPLVDHIDYTRLQYGLPALATHPYDDGVLISGATALDEVPDEVDVVVSLCLTGRTQVPAGVEHINFRLMDQAEPEQNPNLDFVLMDAARLVADLRDEGKTVLLHCVAAHSRTPTVAIVYSMLRGVELEDALPAVCGALPAARPNRGFRDALKRLADSAVRD
ncbi:ADP-ribosylglycohydrolase family protein [Nocardioides ganghwensis]|uniref:ADP-ribosylglycohydrolase family protein n=1 Tax=Nocardioides ganghwensis TaxID=252230 RepID=A0A4Q2S9I3_9ACTN|nr:ADP-ribosylglycohydrolase family protein [Nocardioides ganghwensis]MBD3947536.1 ADP-ribosylglycohydrolase family protein [Nocardioides ganghwensis]RYB99443.1 ADP-ribosylglycohydrolase family protein [Nocardioides ganghwensis]